MTETRHCFVIVTLRGRFVWNLLWTTVDNAHHAGYEAPVL